MGVRGRASTFNREIADKICERLSQGESLRAIARDEGMPHEATVRGWVLDNVDGFATQYTRARHLQAERWAEEIMEISDTPPPLTGDNKMDHAAIQYHRLRVDTRKWLLSKVLPKVYGDKLELRGDANNPVVFQKLERVVVDKPSD
jgi:hypothetical protein